MIGNIIHIIFGMTPDFGGKPWSFIHHLCLQQAIAVNSPRRVYFWYTYEPSGEWWEKSKSLVELCRVEAPQFIGNKPLIHSAHKADVLRLQILQEHGGWYMDCDVFCLKPFSRYNDKSFVIGTQGQDGYGLCNAVMGAEKRAKFIEIWLEEYKNSFRGVGIGEHWDEHSVRLPKLLSRKHPTLLTVLPYNAFHYPLWNDTRKLFTSDGIDVSNSIAIHLWETVTWDWLSAISPKTLREGCTIQKSIIHPVGGLERVSILMLVHNRPVELRKCISSLLSTLRKSYVKELIILDNASTDENVKKFLDNLSSSKIRKYRSETNLGVAGGRKYLSSLASGEFVLFLDSDIYIRNSRWLERLISALRNDIGIVGDHGCRVRNDGEIESIDSPTYEGIVDGITGYCQLFRREVFDMGCSIDDEFDTYGCEDTDFSLQITQKTGKKAYVVKCGIEHNWGCTNKTGEKMDRNIEYFKTKWQKKKQ